MQNGTPVGLTQAAGSVLPHDPSPLVSRNFVMVMVGVASVVTLKLHERMALRGVENAGSADPVPVGTMSQRCFF